MEEYLQDLARFLDASSRFTLLCAKHSKSRDFFKLCDVVYLILTFCSYILFHFSKKVRILYVGVAFENRM